MGAATTAIRTAVDGSGQYFCARLDAPLKWHYGPDLDTIVCAAQFLGRDRAGEFLWVDDIVLTAHEPGEQPYFGMRHFAVDLFVVTNPSLLTDAHLDPTKTHLVGIAEIDDADNSAAPGFPPLPRPPAASPSPRTTTPPPRPAPVSAPPATPKPPPTAPATPPPAPAAPPPPAAEAVRPARHTAPSPAPEPPTPASPPPAPPVAPPAPPPLSTATPSPDRDRVVAAASVPRPAAPADEPPVASARPQRPDSVPPPPTSADTRPDPEPAVEPATEVGETSEATDTPARREAPRREADEDTPAWLDPPTAGRPNAADSAYGASYDADVETPAPRPYTPPTPSGQIPVSRPAAPAPPISVPTSAPPRDAGRLMRLLGAAALILGVIVAAALWAFSRGAQSDDAAGSAPSTSSRPSRTPTAPPAPTTDPRQVDKLLTLLPPGYPPQACKPVAADAGLATVSCDPTPDPEGPRTATYTLAAGKTDLDEQFKAVIATTTQVVCPGNIQSPGAWHHNATPEIDQGTLYCGFRGQVPVVAWTDTPKMVLHVAESSPTGPNLETLFRWWSSHS